MVSEPPVPAFSTEPDTYGNETTGNNSKLTQLNTQIKCDQTSEKVIGASRSP